MGSESKKMCFVQNYDEIRELVRIFYLYGCFDKNELRDYDLVDHSVSKYDQLIKKIKAYVDTIEESYHTLTDGRKSSKTISIVHKTHEDEYNYFCDTYKMKNMRKAQAYLAYMQLVSQDDVSISELAPESSSPFTPGDRKNQINHLEELSDMGYIEYQKQGNKYYCSEKQNIFDTDLFSDEDFILRFLDFVSLLRNKIQPYVCGNMLLETALMFWENNKSTSELAENYVSPFFVNDGHFEQVLDDEVLYRLITAMDLGKPVAFAYDDTEYKNIYPIKAVTNVESGLRYLFSYVSDEEKYVFFSLDKITGLEIALKSLSFDYEKYEREYEKRTKYSFSGVTCLNDGEEPIELLLEVRTSEFLKNMKKLFLPDSIKTDKPENKNYYTAKVLVNTLEELKPWLRRNMNNVRLVGTEVMNDEVGEMRELYGII